MKTIIHFKYGGSYSESVDGFRWTSKEPRAYSITFKTEEITYSALEDMIYKKMGIDRHTTKLKLSYFPLAMGDKFPSYILDDDEVSTYLLCKEESRSFLHVEVTVVEVESSFGLNYEEKGEEEPLGEGVVGEDDGIPSESVNVKDDEEDNDWDSEDEYGSEDEDGSEDGDVDHVIGNEIVEVPCDDNENEYVMEWDDETGLKLHQEFKSKFEPQEILQRASHSKSFEFEICNSDTFRYVIKCRGEGCKWYIRVRKQRGGYWKIVTYRDKHTCSTSESCTSIKKRPGNVRLVAAFLKRECPNLKELPKPKAIMANLKDKIGLDVSYWTALRGKKEAENSVRGNPVESFKILPSYLFMLEKANPGSVTRCALNEEGRFQYLFVALGACIEGFQAMRKVLQVDATFLKTGRGGVLAIATAQDPNHHHYPIAFGVLDGENDASWNWFFTQMRSIVEDDPELVWISDRNSSLIKGIRELYPRAQHGFCMWHLSMNVRGKIGSKKKEACWNKFKELATVYTEVEFLEKYEEFGELFPLGREYLETSVVEGPKKWARCYFPGERYNINTTNSAESLNNVLKDARGISLLLMIDRIIDKLAEWFNKHRKESIVTSGPNARKLVPFVENVMSSRIADAKKLTVNELNSFMLEYSVVTKDGKAYLVELMKKSCTCKRFDIDKYPCVHGVAALLEYMKWKERPKDIHVHELCSEYYHMTVWAAAYLRTIYPVPHQSEWSGIPESIQQSSVLPPMYKKRKGRNQTTRIPSGGEKRRKVTNKHVPYQNLANLFGINTNAETSADASQV